MRQDHNKGCVCHFPTKDFKIEIYVFIYYIIIQFLYSANPALQLNALYKAYTKCILININVNYIN